MNNMGLVRCLLRLVSCSLLFLFAACTQAATPDPVQPSPTPPLLPSETSTAVGPSLPPPATPTGEPSPTPLPEPTTQATLPPTPTAFPTATALPPLAPGSPLTLTRLEMLDETSGWAMDERGYILRTQDGGRTWLDVTPPAGNVALGDVADPLTAWAIPLGGYQLDANGNIAQVHTSAVTWRTVDGGLSWQPSQPFSLGREFSDGSIGYITTFGAQAQFIDRQTGWLRILGDPESRMTVSWLLYQTTDGGESWSKIADSEHNQTFLLSTVFTSETEGWGAGAVLGFAGPADTWNASLYRTQDGGRTWQNFALPPPAQFPDEFTGSDFDCGAVAVHAIPGGMPGVQADCIVFDGSANPRVSFFHLTPDQGQTWHTGPFTSSMDFIDPQIGWRISRDEGSMPELSQTEGPAQGQAAWFYLQTTRDGGQTWQTLRRVTWQGPVDFVSETHGWVIALAENARALLATQDGGNTWTELRPEIAAPTAP